VTDAVSRNVKKAVRGIAMTNDERNRIGRLLGDINQPSLFARIRQQAESDGTPPVSKAEWACSAPFGVRATAPSLGTTRALPGPSADDLR
jgi:hypothetical protein